MQRMCYRNKDGSHATQANRKRILDQMATRLHELGYRNMKPQSLKSKHIEVLVKDWKEQNITDATMKNRMAAIRWWAEKVDKSSYVAKSNSFYGIADRKFVTNIDKGQELDSQKLSQIKDHYIESSLELQAVFGLRREEAIKFMPSYADQGDHIVLKASWCKGGKERIIPIKTSEQRKILDKSHKVAGKTSLIPIGIKYIQQLKRYEKQTSLAGFSKMHGLRHKYAQDRYKVLTSLDCPIQGGKAKKEMTDQEKEIDHEARLIISKELGHEREQVTAIYLGR